MVEFEEEGEDDDGEGGKNGDNEPLLR